MNAHQSLVGTGQKVVCFVENVLYETGPGGSTLSVIRTY